VIVVVGVFSMETPQSTSDRALVRRLRTCPNCGAQTPPHLAHCWVCQEDLRKFDRRALKVNQFSMGAFFLVTALLGAILAVFRVSSLAGVVLLAISIPATVRTIWTAQMWKAGGDRMPLGALLDTFISSAGVSVTAWVLGIAAFIFGCTCAGIMAAELLVLPAAAVGLATAACCYWIMRPRD
jgi:hypothetical protein